MQYRYLLIALVLALPPAAATFNMKGSYEPDTAHDLNDGLMTLSPDTTPCGSHTSGCDVNMVYFNHLEDTIDGPSVGSEAPVSPNVAATQSSFGSPQEEDIAFLGVWKDCNADGYVGLGENAQWEYRSAILTAEDTAHVGPGTSICPVQPMPSDQFHGLVHNDGSWVHEFISIGYDASIFHTTFGNKDRFMIFDPAARVWGDNGLPGANVGNICWLSPSPIGTLHTVGSIEDTVDCNDNSVIANQVAPVIAGSPLGPAYATARSVHNPWGEVTDPSAAYVFDCSNPNAPLAQQQVQGFHFAVYPPLVPPQVGTGASPAGTIRELGNELDDCKSSDDITNNQWEYQAANGPYAKETNRVTSQQQGDKIQADQPLFFVEPSRNLAGEGTALGPSTMEDLGAGLAAPPGIWQSQSLDAQSPAQYERNCVPPPTSPSGCQADTTVKYVTYYAHVTATTQGVEPYTLTLPSSASTLHTYGSEACGSFTSGIHGVTNSAPGVGWDCDPAHWYKNTDGSNSNYFDPSLCIAQSSDPARANDPTNLHTDYYGNLCYYDTVVGKWQGAAMGASPGWSYDMRDVDCYDSSVGAARNNGVSWATVGGDSSEPGAGCISGN